MPKAGAYRANSVIYFQGDASDKVYVLQSGVVSLNYTDIENGKDLHDIIQKGEFFGVKSALGKYPREENAVVLQDCTVVAFTVPEFEQLALSNTRVILKMLKVFSNQLRRIHRQVENLLKTEEQESPEQGLFKTGQYYLKNRMYAQAHYVFSRYLTYYPNGRNAQEAAKYLETAETAQAKFGQGRGPAPIPEAAKAQAAAPEKSRELSDVAKVYYNGVSLFSSQKYQEAFKEFKGIVDSGSDPEYVAKASFEMGRCLFLLGQADGCIRHFTAMIQSYPKHPDLPESLFYIGQSHEKKGDAEKAAAFYKKVLSMSRDEDDPVGRKAKKALKALGVG
jgi:CRP-like cAMP-binding protein